MNGDEPPELTLYGYWRSSSTWRVRIALELKGFEYRVVPVHMLRSGGEQHAAPFATMSPMQQVPALKVGATGVLLVQSMAIIDYLDQLRPLPGVFPTDAVERAQALAQAEVVNSGIQPLQNLGTLQCLADLAPEVDVSQWVKFHMLKGLGALERLVQTTARTYCVGDSVSVADLCLIPQLYNARRFAVPLDAFPRLLAIEDVCEQHGAFQRARPERQPDAEVLRS